MCFKGREENSINKVHMYQDNFSDFKLPTTLFPTAAQDRISDTVLADALKLDVTRVRAMNCFTRDLLISRAIEGGFIRSNWSPKGLTYTAVLDELSRAILGHWSKLLTQTERDERRHVQFVLRIVRRQYVTTRSNQNVI